MNTYINEKGFSNKFFFNIYYNFIKNTSRSKFIFKILLILEIIPLLIILDEVIFIRSSNHIFSFIYFLSSGIWARLIQNKLSTNLVFPDKYILENNVYFKDLKSNFQADNYFNNNNNNNENLSIKDYTTILLNKEKNSIFTTCMNFFLEKNGTTHFLNNSTSVFSSNYDVYFDNKSNIFLIIFAIILLISLLLFSLSFENNFLQIHLISTNALNFLVRTASFFFMVLITNKIFEIFYIKTFREIDIEYANSVYDFIRTDILLIFLIALYIIFIVFYYLYSYYVTCLDLNYPYDFKSKSYDYFMLVMKITGALLYNLQKLSCVLGQLNTTFRFLCLFYSSAILFFGLFFLLKFKKLVKFSQHNKFRCLLIFCLNAFLFFKILEFYFIAANLIALDYILLLSLIFVCITIYYKIKNKTGIYLVDSDAFLKDSLLFDSDNYFSSLLNKLFGRRKSEYELVKESRDNEYCKMKKLKNFTKEILNFSFEFLNLVKKQDAESDKIYKNFCFGFIKNIVFHKVYCDCNISSSKSSKNNNTDFVPGFIKKFKSKIQQVKKNSFNNINNNINDNNNNSIPQKNIQKLGNKEKERHDLLYVKYINKTPNQDGEDNNYNSKDLCELCFNGNILIEEEKINSLFNLSIVEIKQLISNFLNAFSKQAYAKLKNYFYFELLRIILYQINSQNNKINKAANEKKILFDLHRNLSNLSTKRGNKQKYNFYLYHYKSNFSKKQNELQNNKENKLVHYIKLNEEYQKAAETLKNYLGIFAGSIKIDLVNQAAKKIHFHKHKIKELIKISINDINKDASQEFYISFHYNYIFNNYSRKLKINEVNMDLIDLAEEFLEKNDNIILEYAPNIRNFTFKSVNSEFLFDLKYEFKELHGENITKIFPYFISEIQLNKILLFIENEQKENFFRCKFLVTNSQKNIKFSEFSFKIIISLDLKIYLLAKHRNPDYIESEIVSPRIYKPQNLLVIHEKGWIISQSESFRDCIIRNDRLVKNFFEILNIQGEKFLELFFSPKFCGKFVDLGKLTEKDLDEKILSNANKFVSMLTSYYESELREFLKVDEKENITLNDFNNNNYNDNSKKLKKKQNLPQQGRKMNSISSNTLSKFVNKNKTNSNPDLNEMKEYNYKNSITNEDDKNINNNNNKNKRFIEVRITDLFKSEILNDEKENYINFKIIHISILELFEYQQSFYFIFDFEKLAFKQKQLSVQKTSKLGGFTSKIYNELKKLTGNENLNSENASVNYQNQNTVSTISISKSDDSLPKIIKDNIKTYLKIKQKSEIKKIQYIIYFLNILLILLGIVFIIVFSQMLENFNNLINDGYYNFRILQVRYNVQLINFVTFLYKSNNNNNNSIDAKTNSLNSKQQINDFIKVQNNVIQGMNKNFQNFVALRSFDSEILKKFKENLNYFEASTRENSYIIRSGNFIELLNFYFSKFLVMENIQDFESSRFKSNNPFDLRETTKNRQEVNTALIIIFKNYFSVVDKNFDKLNNYFLDYLDSHLNYLEDLVNLFNLIFFLIQLAILFVLFIFIFMSYKKISIIFKFFDRIENDHFEYLVKKFDLLCQSTRFLINPKEFLSMLSQLKKKIMDTNFNKNINNNINNNNNNNDANKKDLEANYISSKNSSSDLALGTNTNLILENKKHDSNTLKQIKELYSSENGKENKKNEFGSNLKKLAKENLKLLKIQIQRTLSKYFLKPVLLLGFIYCFNYLFAILFIGSYLEQIKLTLNITNLSYEDQINFFDSFILLNIGYVSNMNIEFALSEINNNEFLDEKYFVLKEKEAEKKIYLEKFEIIFQKLMQSIKSKKKIEANNSAFSSLRLFSEFKDNEAFCKFAIDSNDIIFASLNNFKETQKDLLLYCYSKIKDSFSINTMKVSIMNKLRNDFLVLEKNDFSQRNFFNTQFLSESLENFSDFYISIMRPYYNKYRNAIIAPFLRNQLDNTLYICICCLIINVVFDIICLLIIKTFIFNKAKIMNKYLVNFIDVLKK